MAERPAQINGPGRLHLYGIVPHDRDADGGCPLPLDFPLDQPHGLIADASAGRKHYHVRAVLSYPLCDLGRRRVDQRQDVRPGDMSHEAIMISGNLCNRAFAFELPQALRGKDHVDVTVRVRVVVIVVGDHQVFERAGEIDDTPGRIAVPVGHIEGLLVAVMHARGRHHSHGALRKRLYERRPGHVLRFPWRVGLHETRRERGKPRDHARYQPIFKAVPGHVVLHAIKANCNSSFLVTK